MADAKVQRRVVNVLKIRLVGNTHVVTLPVEVVENMGLKKGDFLHLVEEDGLIIIKKEPKGFRMRGQK